METGFFIGLICGLIINEWLFPQTKNEIDLKIKNSNVSNLSIPDKPQPKKRFLDIFKRKGSN